MRGLDILQPLIDDPEVTEIMVNGYEDIFFLRKKTEFSITPMCISAIRSLVIAKYNIFISGGTGSGKTTFFVFKRKNGNVFLVYSRAL